MSVGIHTAQRVSGNSIWCDPAQWTDRSSPTTTVRIGALSKPDFDYTNLGLLFPQNDTSEKVYILDQMQHQKKLDTSLRLHVHFVQDSADIPNFVAEYRAYNNGGAIPAFSTIDTDSGAGPLFTYPGSGSIAQLVRFPEIVMPSPENVSAVLEIIFYRDDNVVTGDVLVKYIDYHYQVDAAGSRQEFVK